MSGNHYSKQVAELEHLLDQKLKQMHLLEGENAKLKQREHALQTAIGSRTGALLATKQLLESSNPASIPSPSDSASTVSRGSVLCAPSPTAVQEEGTGSSVLAELHGREEEVQQLLNQVGEGHPQQELYSTWLLRRATNNPARAASHLAMSKQYRLAHLVSWVPKMGVLLPKYDAKGAATATGSAKEQCDYLVDELTEKLLVCGLWDPPEKRFVNLMVNVDTQQYEPYPDGWWQQVAQAVGLTDEQKAAIRVVYERMNDRKVQLIEQHKEVAEQVATLQERKREQLRAFQKQADNLPSVLMPPQQQQHLMQANQQQQQQRAAMQQLQQRLVQQQQAALQAQQQQCMQQWQQQQSRQQLQQQQQQQQQSRQQQQQLMDLQIQHVQQQKVLQGQISQAQPTQQHPLQQTQQDMLQQLLDDGEDFGLDFDLDLPLMSCGTLAAAAVAALAQDVPNDMNQQQQQVPSTMTHHPTQHQQYAVIPEQYTQQQQQQQQQEQQSRQQQQQLMDLQIQHLKQQKVLQGQISQAQPTQQHPLQQTQQDMLQQLLDDGEDFGLDFDLDLPLMSCGTLEAAAVAALAQDVPNDMNQQQQQVPSTMTHHPTQHQQYAVIPEQYTQQQQQQQEQQSRQQQQQLMDLQIQHLKQQKVLQRQISQAQQTQQHPLQQTQQDMLQQLLDDGEDFGLDFDLDLPLMSCGTLAAAAVAALAQDVANNMNHHQQQMPSTVTHQPQLQQQQYAVIPEQYTQQHQNGVVLDDDALCQGSGSLLEIDRAAGSGSSSGYTVHPGRVQGLVQAQQRHTGSFTFGQQQQQQQLTQLGAAANNIRETLSARSVAAGGAVGWSFSSCRAPPVGTTFADAAAAAAAPVTPLDPAAAAAMPVQVTGFTDSFSACSVAGSAGGSFVTGAQGYSQQQQQPWLSPGTQVPGSVTAYQSMVQQTQLQHAYDNAGNALARGLPTVVAFQQQQQAQVFEQQQLAAARAAALTGAFSVHPAEKFEGSLNQLIGAAATSATPTSSNSAHAPSDKNEQDVAMPGGAAVDSPAVPVCGSAPLTPSLSGSLAKAGTEGQEELLLDVFNHEQTELEKRLDKISRQIKLLMHFQFFHLVNIMNKKQLAKFYVQSFPFYPDSLSFCEALDELGW